MQKLIMEWSIHDLVESKSSPIETKKGLNFDYDYTKFMKLILNGIFEISENCLTNYRIPLYSIKIVSKNNFATLY